MAFPQYNNPHPAGYQAISATSSTAVGCTIPAAVAPGSTSNYTFFVCETTNVRWRDDGIDPTPTVGTPLAAGAAFDYDGPPQSIKFISTGSAATVHANYYRMG